MDAAPLPEFQKLLTHHGLVGNSVLGAMARVGLARAPALAGDTPATAQYELLSELWRDADSGIPVLRQARAEYRAITPKRLRFRWTSSNVLWSFLRSGDDGLRGLRDWRMIGRMASRWIAMLVMYGVLGLTAALPSTQNRAIANAPLQLPARNPSALSTQVVLLGTGTPSPDPDRSGPATAVVVNGTPYLIDFGPGVVRRIAAASQKGVTGLGVVNVRVAFLTHLHSDHTAGYPDLILTPWSVGRNQPLEVYGPAGLKHMTDHILEAYREDIAIRRRDKQAVGVPEQADGYKVQAHEITPGTVYKDQNVTVKAFLVNHGDVAQAFGYRLETSDRTIVISGDAAPSQSIIDSCNGCDVLIHEAYSMLTYNAVSPAYQEYRRKHHTSSREMAEIAEKARPGLLILYHRANPGGVGRPNPEQALLEEVRQLYGGKVVIGLDLDVF